MLKKLRLNQTQKYEKHLALEEISNMLLFFVKGLPHHLAIGAEQGNIIKWDDFVIQKHDGGNIYIQAKRQTTPFSTDSTIRDRYTSKAKKERIGQLKDLSELDAALEILGNWINSNDFSSSNIKDEFWLEFPQSSIEIKKGLETRHLRDFFESNNKSVTTAQGLSNLENNDKNAQNIFQWLTTWCGFNGWDHILKLMKILTIRTSGAETDINIHVKNNLSQVFQSAKVDKVRLLILSYLDENETFTGAIMPRQLLYLLQDYLLPTIPRWTLFKSDGSFWSISGIHDLEDNTKIERPSILVPALWSAGNPNARWLGIDGACIENCSVSHSLMRLSLHPRGSFDIICCDKPSWQNSIISKTGGTLGVAEDDLDDLRILDELKPSSHSEKKELTTMNEQEHFAKELHNEMYKSSFEYVKAGIVKIIRNMTSGDLRNEVENRWTIWKQLLETNVDEQKNLFIKILHPNAEGESISGELRVGPKTANLLSEAIFLLLVVSVCLSDDKNKSWGAVTDKLKMNSIGLAYWSGPAEGTRKVIRIDDDEVFGNLLEKEPGQVLIIPRSEIPATVAFNDDIFGEITRFSLLTHPRYPKLLITQDRVFKKILRNGNISDLREYFQGILDKYENIIKNEVDKIADGVMI